MMTAVEGAAAVDCPFCRARFFLPDEGHAGWVVEPRVKPAACVAAAKRWLREQRRRVTLVGEPRALLTPFYWSRAKQLSWEVATLARTPNHDPALAGLLGGPVNDPIWEPRFRAVFHRHVFPVHPVSRHVGGGATRAGTQPRTLLDPDRIPAGYELLSPACTPEEAEASAVAWHEGRARRAGAGRGDDLYASRPAFVRLNLLYLPVVLVPFAFREDYSGWVVVDAVAGRAVGELDDAPPEPAAEPELSTAWRQWGVHNPLIPLECATCGWPLALAERDRLHECGQCGSVWELVAGERRRVRQWVSAEPSRSDDRWLPFWVFGSGGGEDALPDDPWFVPAYRARHMTPQLHVAVALRRSPPDGRWYARPDHHLAGAALGSEEAAAWRWAVSGAVERESLKDFISFLRRQVETGSAEPAGVVWLPFARQAGDLVCRLTGTRTRAVGTVPWGSSDAVTQLKKTA